MKIALFFLACFLGPLNLLAQDSLARESQQAKAFAQTRDFTQASAIYEELSERQLPDWQQAIILYNWGTVKLFQQQWEQALDLFYRIPLRAVSSPLLLRSLTLNKAWAYLGQAKQLAALDSQQNLSEQLNLVWQSLEELKNAAEIDCRMQQLEDSSADCKPSLDLTSFSKKALFQLNQVKQRQREEFLVSADPLFLWLLLTSHLQTFIDLSASLNEESISSDRKEDYQQLLLSLAQPFSSLWNRLKEQDLSDEQLLQVDKGLESYLKALSFFEQIKINEAQESLKASLQAIQGAWKPSDLDSLLFHYHLLLLEEINAPSLLALLEEQKKLPIQSDGRASLESANHYLETALNQLRDKHPFMARFFVLGSLILLENLQADEKASKTPLSILKQALHSAERTEQLVQLANLAEDPASNLYAEGLAFIETRQKIVLQQSEPFIGASLAQEKALFNEAKKNTSCQKTPWDRVIPLFEAGYRSAQQAQLWSSIRPLPALAVLNQHKQTIRNWKQALDKLEHPPSSQQELENQNLPQDQEQEVKPPESGKDLNETLRLIQEMQAQDEPQQGTTPQEGHTW